MRLDAAPMSLAKFVIKALKHSAWSRVALWTGYTFVGYFTPIHDLGVRAITWQLGPWEIVLDSVLRLRDLRQRRAGCASRCASTCARTRASRA